MKKPDATPIRDETKRELKARAAMNGLSLVDYLEAILTNYFEETRTGEKDERIIIERMDKND